MMHRRILLPLLCCRRHGAERVTLSLIAGEMKIHLDVVTNDEGALCVNLHPYTGSVS
ncbi:hypothetical protein IOC61_05625 [Halomonas sp. KAO]|uniref:hypothetical protein n=1 Tax=Halomonas sp. KAO TaxID=2783858 RepID=UPI00189F16FD|nr:hypothetical protein [Halomonas sp. KAO]MBF7052797.1 hypothetical protein [Halomonas sp. KAO]